ncbi:hypothetical protein QLQ12_17420 [Actinoplanes sp. NEAU-A12]|uniref:Peptidase metallopeptidase domain-containing protein n=1 Tax=Actinoplanes sandaracinus TaxID=3045177 RepID=A0ABT6WKY8_9ACTN|nr:hypothetical protein [Actinoplanes sandaracinus]MDI6100390.1 hypothetical protein [Actinoplanes sandaracinus]
MLSQVAPTTLAAQILAETPELRQAAQRTQTYAQLEERCRRVILDGERSYYVLEGDLLFDEDELTIYALQKAQSQGDALVSPNTSAAIEPAPALVGIAAGNRVVRWAPDRVLGYCVIRASFPDQQQYEKVRDNMAAAAAAWEATCGVDFAYMPLHDGHPDPSTPASDIDPSLVFSVRYIDAGAQFIAAAFFPTYPPDRRRVLIDPSYFAEDLTFDRVGVLRHELGHVLGFRHEHIRSNAPAVCPNEPLADTVDLTAYDPKSVMHYFCGGVGSPDLKITEVDREGAQKLYGPPWDSVTLVQ